VSGWRIEFKPSSLREFTKLPKDVQKAIGAALDGLAFELSNPGEPKRSNVKAMQGAAKGEYRLRVGDYRVRYALEGDRLVVYVVRVGHRRDVYR
jgi:mRNA interferase RelE/StbE